MVWSPGNRAGGSGENAVPSVGSALLNVYVFGFVIHNKTRRTQQGNLVLPTTQGCGGGARPGGEGDSLDGGAHRCRGHRKPLPQVEDLR